MNLPLALVRALDDGDFPIELRLRRRPTGTGGARSSSPRCWTRWSPARTWWRSTTSTSSCASGWNSWPERVTVCPPRPTGGGGLPPRKPLQGRPPGTWNAVCWRRDRPPRRPHEDPNPGDGADGERAGGGVPAPAGGGPVGSRPVPRRERLRLLPRRNGSGYSSRSYRGGGSYGSSYRGRGGYGASRSYGYGSYRGRGYGSYGGLRRLQVATVTGRTGTAPTVTPARTTPTGRTLRVPSLLPVPRTRTRRTRTPMATPPYPGFHGSLYYSRPYFSIHLGFRSRTWRAPSSRAELSCRCGGVSPARS